MLSLQIENENKQKLREQIIPQPESKNAIYTNPLSFFGVRVDNDEIKSYD